MTQGPMRGAMAITARSAGTLGQMFPVSKGSSAWPPAHSAQSATRLPIVLSPVLFRLRVNEAVWRPMRVAPRRVA